MSIAPARTTALSNRWNSALLRPAIGLGIGVLLVIVFLQLVSFSRVYKRLEHLNIPLALLCGAVFLAAFVVRALRWRLFLRPHRIGIRRVVSIYFIAMFINWLLPIRAGELAKCLLLRRSDGIQISESLATVTMDKAMDLLPAVALVLLLPATQIHLTHTLWLLLLTALVALGSGALVLIIAAWRRDRMLAWLTGIVAAVLPQRVRVRVEPSVRLFVDTLIKLIQRPRLLLVASAYTLVAVCLDATFCYLAFRAVGVAVSVPTVLFGYTLYNLAYLLPTPPGQIGSNELFGLLIFSGVFGVSRSGVGAMFVFSHPWTAILMASCGTICLSSMGMTVRGTFGLARNGGSEAAP
jgi:uncharacterized protein (TIRG00374 family)